MNILLNGTLILCIVCMVYGYAKGFVRIAVTLVATIATLVLVGMFVPKVTDLIIEYTALDEAIELKFVTAMFGDGIYTNESDGSEELTLAEQVELIEGIDVPEYLKEAALDDNNSEIYEQLGVTTFAEYISSYLSTWTVSVLAYIVTFLIVWCVMRAIVFAIDTLVELPVLNWINRTIGAVFGLGFAVVIIWIVFLGLTLMYSSEIGRMCYAWIEESSFLTYMYMNNPMLIMLLG